MKTIGSLVGFFSLLVFFFFPHLSEWVERIKAKKESFFKHVVIAHCLNTQTIDTYTKFICMDELG